jgi:hypothetical protein
MLQAAPRLDAHGQASGGFDTSGRGCPEGRLPRDALADQLNRLNGDAYGRHRGMRSRSRCAGLRAHADGEGSLGERAALERDGDEAASYSSTRPPWQIDALTSRSA